jgi:hypothetical protein
MQLNVEYGVLICIGNGCQCAVGPASFSDHLRRKHKTPLELREQVDRYIDGFPFKYDYSDVPLPQDGLAPQPIIRVVEGLRYKYCVVEQPASKTQSRDVMKKHGNKAYSKKRVADEDLFDRVRLQSWFWEGKERYWVIDERKLPGRRRPDRASLAGRSSDGEGAEDNDGGSSQDGDGDQEEEEGGGGDDAVEDQIAQEMQNWCEEVKERRLKLLEKVPVAELDFWLQFTKWNAVLEKSRHNIVQTYWFLRKPDPDEPELERLLVC